MYIDPDLLAELDEEQKQLLFCKMREEQVRRWKLREKEEERKSVHQKKMSGKKVTFQVGMDGEPLVVVFKDKDFLDSIHAEQTRCQAEREDDSLRNADENELDRFVRLTRSTVQAMEEEASRNAEHKEQGVASLQDTSLGSDNQLHYLEDAELSQNHSNASLSLFTLSLSPSLLRSNPLSMPVVDCSQPSLLGIPSRTKPTIDYHEGGVSASMSTLSNNSTAHTNVQYSDSLPTSISSSSHPSSAVFYSSTHTERKEDGAKEDIPLTLTAVANTIGVADHIKRWEQLSEGSLEAIKAATTLEHAKKRQQMEVLEQHHCHTKQTKQQVAQIPFNLMERNETAWHEQEQKAKDAEKRIREIARRAREEHRRSSVAAPIHAINRNLTGLTHDSLLKNEFNDINSYTDGESDINGNIGNGLDDISNNNSQNKSRNHLEKGTTGSPAYMGCSSQRLRPPKPPSRASIVSWFQEEELPRGAGLNLSNHHIAPWFHGVISRVEAEELLEESKVGSFLVRVSERIWGYTISYRAADRFRHYLIDVTGGRYTFFGSHQAAHKTLGELVEYHTGEPITSAGQELLTYPCAQTNSHKPDYLELFAGTRFMSL